MDVEIDVLLSERLSRLELSDSNSSNSSDTNGNNNNNSSSSSNSGKMTIESASDISGVFATLGRIKPLKHSPSADWKTKLYNDISASSTKKLDGATKLLQLKASDKAEFMVRSIHASAAAAAVTDSKLASPQLQSEDVHPADVSKYDRDLHAHSKFGGIAALPIYALIKPKSPSSNNTSNTSNNNTSDGDGIDYEVLYRHHRELTCLEWLSANESHPTKINVREFGQVFTATAKAISKIHAHGIAHLDLRPFNIFVTDSSVQETRAYISSFGMSVDVGKIGHGKTATASVVAGPMRPPECLTSTVLLAAPSNKNAEEADGIDAFAADVFSLGISLLQAAFGSRLFGKNKKKKRNSISTEVTLGASRTPTGQYDPNNDSSGLNRKELYEAPDQLAAKVFEKLERTGDADAEYSAKLQALLVGMIAVDPSKRPTIHSVVEQLSNLA
ncbi:hypothetical protein GQ42DRAFT_179879 [Ramicandelaber brevisporus]|nr:hypothetical protein GQ42DRAFT_179879 [Ramicandelaber brevisporus]